MPDVPANVCGNGVVEASNNEECDGWARADWLCRGPEDKENGCRYDCSVTKIARNGKTPVCPDDKQCGTDGLCRTGSGKYSPWGKPLALQAQTLDVGDLDGDGRADLVTLGNPNQHWQAFPRVVFFDKTGKPEEPVFNPQTLVSSPVLAPIILGDERKHIVMGTPFGIAVLGANSERKISARPYPAQSLPADATYRMVRVRGVRETQLEEEVVVYVSESGQNVLLASTSNAKLGVLERAVTELSGPPAAGNIDERTLSPCDEVVLAYKSTSDIYAVHICDAIGKWLTAPIPPQVIASLPAGHQTRSSVTLARVNDDARLDLVIADDHGCPYVTFGLGDGTFAANLEYPALTLGQLWPVVTPSSRCPEYPLAIGELNQTGLADWAIPGGIQLVSTLTADPPSTESPSVRLESNVIAAPFLHQWSNAAIAEFTGDTHLDLVASSADSPDLDFLIGTGKDGFNPTTLSTEGRVQSLVTGDFNGDLINDIALTQVHELAAEKPIGLAVAYGNLASPPTPPTEIAGFFGVAQLLSANYQTDDAIEELGVLATSADDIESQLTLFVGNLGRSPISSLGLWKVIPNVPTGETEQDFCSLSARSLASTVGRFGADASWGMLSLAQDDCARSGCSSGACASSFRLWYAPSIADGTLAAPSDVVAVPGFIPIRNTNTELSAQFVVAALNAKNHEAQESALLLTAGPDESMVTLWRVNLPLGSEPVTLLSSARGQLSPSSSPKLLDLDGNGTRDLVLLLNDDSAKPRLTVVWSRDGTFDLAQAEIVDIGDAGTVRGFASVGVKESEGLLVATDFGINRVHWLEKQRTIEQVLFVDSVVRLPAARAIAVGDMTGDGLADIVLSIPGGLSVFAQTEILEISTP